MVITRKNDKAETNEKDSASLWRHPASVGKVSSRLQQSSQHVDTPAVFSDWSISVIHATLQQDGKSNGTEMSMVWKGDPARSPSSIHTGEGSEI